MNIFARRPLFTYCVIFSAFAVLCFFINATAKIIITGIFLFSVLIFTALYILNKVSGKTALNVTLTSLFVIAAVFSSYLYFDVNYLSYTQLNGTDHTIEAIVLSERYRGGNLSGYDIRVTEIDGEECSCKAVLDCTYISDIRPGYYIKAEVFAEEFENNINGYNEKQNLLSDGIFLSLTSYDEQTYEITDENYPDFSVWLKKINFRLSYNLRTSISGDEGNLCAALFLGDRSYLDDSVLKGFERAGVSHILALSGMHMSIIMGIFGMLLQKLRIHKYIRAIVLSLLAVFYLAITGFSVSATRSVIMLMTVYISMLFSLRSDPLTSLSVACALILFISPGAVIDAGFWMSFAATFGLIVYMPIAGSIITKLFSFTKKFRVLYKALSYIAGLFFAGICALIPLLLVLCIFIKEISVYSVWASAVLSIPTAGVILFSLILTIAFNIPFVKEICVDILRKTSGFMIDFCSKISDKENIVYSIDYDFTYVFAILLFIAFAATLILKFKHKITSLIPVASVVLIFIITTISYNNINSDKINITYLSPSSISDMIVMTNNRECVIFDISNGSKKSYNAAIEASKDFGVTEINAVVLTDFHTAHSPILSELFKSEKVRQLYIPYPDDADSYYNMLSVLEKAEENKVEVFVYGASETLEIFGNAKVQILRGSLERSAVPVTLIDVACGDESLVYVSSAYPESPIAKSAENKIKASDYLIIGARGPKPNALYSVENNENLQSMVISDYEQARFLDISDIPKDLILTVNTERSDFIMYKERRETNE